MPRAFHVFRVYPRVLWVPRTPCHMYPRAPAERNASAIQVPRLSWIAALPERRVHRRLFVLDLRCNCQIVPRGLGEPTTSDRLFESCFKAFADDHTSNGNNQSNETLQRTKLDRL